MMKVQMLKLVLGASAFGITLLYFYALALSMVTGTVPEYIVLAAWAGVGGRERSALLFA